MTAFDVAGRGTRSTATTVDRLAGRGVRGDETTISGLLAAGKCMGEDIKTVIRGGNSLADAFAFDRITGESAARKFVPAMTREEAEA
ncbi:hypothetical protein ACIBQ0_36075 [Nocardia nova]|uniref:hypothetical protein n=1 Tax=Nocardia nova TaxID=37330 RepID=UPI0037882E7A